MMPARIRVLLVEDSPFLCKLLKRYLESAGDFEVCAMAHTGREALATARAHQPDVVSMDLTLPDRDGVEVLAELMRERPVPVVVLTGATGTSSMQTVDALEAGAADFVLKFDPSAPVAPEGLAHEIVTKLRRAARRQMGLPLQRPVAPDVNGVVVVGASTGGPGALRELLGAVPAAFPLPIVVVQHVPAAFAAALVQDLSRTSRLPVSELRAGARLGPGVFVTPGGQHVEFEGRGGVRLRPEDEEPYCPSIDVAMESAAQVFGAGATGVLLTGMGNDGVRGLGAIRRAGGRTLVQEPGTCVVPGMPAAALAQGIVQEVATPAALGALLGGVRTEELTHAR